MSYRAEKFVMSPDGIGQNLKPLGQEINSWLAINEFVSVVGMTVSWKDSQRRGNAANVHLFFREGGARQYAMDFVGIAGYTARDQVNDFFTANPGFIAVTTVDLSSPYQTPPQDRLVIIYQKDVDLIKAARPGVFGGYAPAIADLPAGSYGNFADVNLQGPGLVAVNANNNAWPQGVAGILARNVDSAPDLSKESYPIGGLGPSCQASGVLAATPDALGADCGCEEPPFNFTNLSTSSFSQTTPVATTTLSTTSPYPTSTTSTTTTSTTSTTTTSTTSTTTTSTTTTSTTTTTTSTTTTTTTTSTTTTSTTTTTTTTSTTTTTTSTTTTSGAGDFCTDCDPGAGSLSVTLNDNVDCPLAITSPTWDQFSSFGGGCSWDWTDSIDIDNGTTVQITYYEGPGAYWEIFVNNLTDGSFDGWQASTQSGFEIGSITAGCTVGGVFTVNATLEHQFGSCNDITLSVP